MFRECIRPNYTTKNDYDPEGVEWADATAIGNDYELEISCNTDDSRYRFPHEYGSWIKGNPPK